MKEHAAKRLFDFVFSLICLFISFPLWIIIILLIKFQAGGPVFYIQERVGKDGKFFKGIKFCSMRPDAEKLTGPMQARENDPRTTKIGSLLRKTAMDELPQLISILKGEMSFVGPRALRPKERETHDDRIKSVFDYPDFKERSKARPGLTGVAQIFAPRDISRSEKFKYDLWYIKNQSFLLDIYLIILSFFVTFSARWESRRDKFSFLAGWLKERMK